MVLKASSLIKKGLSSTCRVILIWKLTPASRKSSSKYLLLVLDFIYESLYASILRLHYYSQLIELSTDLSQATPKKQVTVARNYFKSCYSYLIFLSSSHDFVTRS